MVKWMMGAVERGKRREKSGDRSIYNCNIVALLDASLSHSRRLIVTIRSHTNGIINVEQRK